MGMSELAAERARKMGYSEAGAAKAAIGADSKGFTDLKRTKKEAKKMSEPCSIGSSDAYPYGLELRFDHESVEKMKLSELPEVGGEVTLIVRGKVMSAESRESADDEDGARRSFTVQVQKVKMGPVSDPDDNDAEDEE